MDSARSLVFDREGRSLFVGTARGVLLRFDLEAARWGVRDSPEASR